MAVEALKKGRARGSATETTPASTTASSEKIEPSAASDTLYSQAFMVTSRVAGHLEEVHASLAQALAGWLAGWRRDSEGPASCTSLFRCPLQLW